MWIVKMNGDFQALFAMESDAAAFRQSRQRLFPEHQVDIYYLPPNSALIDALTA